MKSPQLQAQVIENAARKQWEDAGMELPRGSKVSFVAPDGKNVIVLRPITETDAYNGGERWEDIGKARAALVDSRGLDVGSLAQMLPELPIMAAEYLVGVPAGAGAAFLTKSPSIGITTTSTVNAALQCGRHSV
jgi:hypothetical protein